MAAFITICTVIFTRTVRATRSISIKTLSIFVILWPRLQLEVKNTGVIMKLPLDFEQTTLGSVPIKPKEGFNENF